MKWEAVDTKTDVGLGTTRDYKISLNATEKNNILTVVVNVEKAPWRVKPTTWTGTDIRSIVSDKGFNIKKTLSQPTLNNKAANSKTYIFELVPKVKKKVEPVAGHGIIKTSASGPRTRKKKTRTNKTS